MTLCNDQVVRMVENDEPLPKNFNINQFLLGMPRQASIHSDYIHAAEDLHYQLLLFSMGVDVPSENRVFGIQDYGTLKPIIDCMPIAKEQALLSMTKPSIAQLLGVYEQISLNELYPFLTEEQDTKTGKPIKYRLSKFGEKALHHLNATRPGLDLMVTLEDMHKKLAVITRERFNAELYPLLPFDKLQKHVFIDLSAYQSRPIPTGP